MKDSQRCLWHQKLSLCHSQGHLGCGLQITAVLARCSRLHSLTHLFALLPSSTAGLFPFLVILMPFPSFSISQMKREMTKKASSLAPFNQLPNLFIVCVCVVCAGISTYTCLCMCMYGGACMKVPMHMQTPAWGDHQR